MSFVGTHVFCHLIRQLQALWRGGLLIGHILPLINGNSVSFRNLTPKIQVWLAVIFLKAIELWPLYYILCLKMKLHVACGVVLLPLLFCWDETDGLRNPLGYWWSHCEWGSVTVTGSPRPTDNMRNFQQTVYQEKMSYVPYLLMWFRFYVDAGSVVSPFWFANSMQPKIYFCLMVI